MGKKKDKKKVIQKPDPMRKDWRIRDVDSGFIYLLDKWLEDKTQRTGNTISDVFTAAVDDLILKDWGEEKVREINSQFQEQQKKRCKTYFESFEISLEK